jgi:ATP synthase protein I
MSDDPALDKLKTQIERAKEKTRSAPIKEDRSLQKFGRLFNVGIEFVSAVFMGVGCGLFIDWAFDTSPWGLIVMFVMGAAAGLLNIFRTLTVTKTDTNKDTHV